MYNVYTHNKYYALLSKKIVTNRIKQIVLYKLRVEMFWLIIKTVIPMHFAFLTVRITVHVLGFDEKSAVCITVIKNIQFNFAFFCYD